MRDFFFLQSIHTVIVGVLTPRSRCYFIVLFIYSF